MAPLSHLHIRRSLHSTLAYPPPAPHSLHYPSLSALRPGTVDGLPLSIVAVLSVAELALNTPCLAAEAAETRSVGSAPSSAVAGQVAERR